MGVFHQRQDMVPKSTDPGSTGSALALGEFLSALVPPPPHLYGAVEQAPVGREDEVW